jgi:hypothetical protein
MIWFKRVKDAGGWWKYVIFSKPCQKWTDRHYGITWWIDGPLAWKFTVCKVGNYFIVDIGRLEVYWFGSH